MSTYISIRHFDGAFKAVYRHWSFSGLATMVRIVLMYYLNLEKFFNQPDADLNHMLAEVSESPPHESIF